MPPPPSTTSPWSRPRRCLDELYDQHLISEPAPGRYQLHDLLREHGPRPWPPPATPPNHQTPRPTGCWTTTCTPPWAAGRHITHPGPNAYRPPARPAAPPAQAPRPVRPRAGGAPGWKLRRANLHAAADYAASRACFPHGHPPLPAAISGFLVAPRATGTSTAAPPPGAPWPAARRAGDRLGEAYTLRQAGRRAAADRGLPGPPPPASSRPSRCSATSATCPARPTPSPSSASCSKRPATHAAATASQQQAPGPVR